MEKASSHGDDPGFVVDPLAAARRLTCQGVTVELFRRLDVPDVDAALELYAHDAVFLDVRGKPAIRETMLLRGMRANAGKRSRHLITNLRASSIDDDTVIVTYTAAAFTLDGDGPFAARSVFDQRQRLRSDDDGRYRIVEHELSGYDSRLDDAD